MSDEADKDVFGNRLVKDLSKLSGENKPVAYDSDVFYGHTLDEWHNYNARAYREGDREVKGSTYLKDLSTSRTAVYRNKYGQYIVASHGVDLSGSTPFQDIYSAAKNGSGIGDDEYLAELRDIVGRLPQDGEVILTGHSLGGAVSRKLALEKNLKSILINPLTTPATPAPGEQTKTFVVRGDIVAEYAFLQPGETYLVEYKEDTPHQTNNLRSNPDDRKIREYWETERSVM